jgi:hypothetical protein
MSEFTLTTLCVAPIAVLISLLNRKSNRDLIRKTSFWIFAALALAGIAKLPTSDKIFSGLEYEDAYVYNAAARFILSNPKPSESKSLLTDACSVGALDNCQDYATYSGHVIGYPTAIAAAGKLFGYQPNLANMLSYIASVLCAGVLFVAACLIQAPLIYAASAVTIFIFLPFQNLFASATVVEPFSSLYLTLALLAYLICTQGKSSEKRPGQKLLEWTALLLTWTACLLIKREAALLIATLPVVTLLLGLKERKSVTSFGWLIGPVAFIWVLLALFFIVTIDVTETIRAEIPDVEGFPFAPRFIAKLLPYFLSTLADTKLFLGLSIFIPIAIYPAVTRIHKDPNIAYPIALFSAYLLIYSLHYRSYYFIRTGEVTEFDTYRYLVHIVPFYCLTVAYGMNYSFQMLSLSVKKGVWSARAVMVSLDLAGLALSTIQSNKLRIQYSEIERETRLESVDAVLSETKRVNSPYAILTDDVLLYQIRGEGSEFLIDSRMINSAQRLDNLVQILKNREVFYVKKSYQDAEIEKNRYPILFEFLKNNRMDLKFSDPNKNFSVFRLSNNQ